VKRALIIWEGVPGPGRSGGHVQGLNYALALRDTGWQVTIVCDGARAGDTPGLAGLAELGFEAWFGPHCEDVRAGLAVESMRELLREGAFDLVLANFWHTAERYGPLVREELAGARMIVDMVDLVFVREDRERRLGAIERTGSDALRVAGELGTYADADAVIAVAERERDAIELFCAPAGGVHVVPLSPAGWPAEPVPGPEGRSGILLVGSWRHRPNTDGLDLLLDEVLPLVRERMAERVPVRIVGTQLGAELAERLVRGAHDLDVVGRVPSLAAELNAARVLAAPLRFGAGVKVKVLDASAWGLPVVTTRIGAEGLAPAALEALSVADGPSAFADGLCSLLTDDEEWRRRSATAQDWVRAAHGPELVRATFLAAVEAALAVPRD
jgi:glycosyltransferase involved in cell wall biosynthesis